MKSNNIAYHAGGILLKGRKILVVREVGKDFFVVPGGRIEASESSEQTLIRELKEEVGIEVKEEDLEKFGMFRRSAINDEHKYEYDEIRMEAFRVKSWEGDPNPGEHDIQELRWVNSDAVTKEKLGNVLRKDIIPRLKTLDLID